MMSRASTKTPSVRNRGIYRQVCEDNCPQDEVALEHGISQARVSQICKQVRTWKAMNVRDLELGLQQQNYVTIQESRIRTQAKLRQATELFEKSLEPIYDDEGNRQRTKPDHQMFRQMCRLEEQVLKIQLRENEAELQALDANRLSPAWQDEEFCRACLRLIRELIRTYPVAEAQGLALAPLPEFNAKALRTYIRTQQRRARLSGEQPTSMFAYLPADWVAVAEQLCPDEEPQSPAEEDEVEVEAPPAAVSAPLEVSEVADDAASYKRAYGRKVASYKHLGDNLSGAEESSYGANNSENTKTELSAYKAYNAYILPEEGEDLKAGRAPQTAAPEVSRPKYSSRSAVMSPGKGQRRAGQRTPSVSTGHHA